MTEIDRYMLAIENTEVLFRNLGCRTGGSNLIKALGGYYKKINTEAFINPQNFTFYKFQSKINNI